MRYIYNYQILPTLSIIEPHLFHFSLYPSTLTFADAFVFEADFRQGFCIGDVSFVEQEGWFLHVICPNNGICMI